MGVTGILGGAFDPPHDGHVALARCAKEHFDLDRLVVMVVAAPGHKRVSTDADVRLRLARAAFPDDEVVLERAAYTVDALRDGRYDGALFLIGADEFCDFPTWRDPDGVLDHVRLAVATRPGYPRGRVDSVLGKLAHPDRVEFFAIPAVAVASRDVRVRLEAGEPPDGLVPPAVAALIGELGLYGGSHP
jgi:nicotinate-nucleotide adenylyltransferase